MWHASVSVWSADQTRKLVQPGIAERHAVQLLRGVGGDVEWWIFNPDPAVLVGHLRVPVTTVEAAGLPPGQATADAGPSGPQRPRTR